MPSLQKPEFGGGFSGRLWRLRHNTARPDILATDEAQPVDALVVGETDAMRYFIHRIPDCGLVWRPA
jgi:hypothetical protein